MIFEGLLVLSSLVLGYFITKFFSSKLNGETKPKRRIPSRSAPALKAKAPSPVPIEKNSMSEEVPSENLLKLKRGKTKDHVRNLQNLMLRKSEQNVMARSSVSDSVLEEEHKEQINVLSHPVYCPEREPRTEEQQEKIDELKARVADVMIPHFDEEWTYVRFLGARNYDLEKAETLLREAIEWRKNLVPLNDELRDLISLAMAVQMSGMMKSKDKFGRTIMYFCPRRNNAKMREVDNALRVMVWFMDQLLTETKKTHHQKFVVLFNMKGFAMKNNDMQMVRAFLPILQNCYPEVVGRIIIVEYPFIIWGLWKIVKPLLDVRTQNKIQFISADELSDHFNEESIPEEIGGTWEAPEPEVDLWEDGFDYKSWRTRENEVIEDNGIYFVK